MINKYILLSATEITPCSFVYQEGVEIEKMVSVLEICLVGYM
jgi:hypothetical protein